MGYDEVEHEMAAISVECDRPPPATAPSPFVPCSVPHCAYGAGPVTDPVDCRGIHVARLVGVFEDPGPC
ncbi:hypothetical protein [Streptomyces sp. NPDC047065]|uniref:hypothetical protein n=1 Tax=Streptomyces sp. NPDC047065 TaxID=3154606 RepID=UPI0033F4153A